MSGSNQPEHMLLFAFSLDPESKFCTICDIILETAVLHPSFFKTSSSKNEVKHEGKLRFDLFFVKY